MNAEIEHQRAEQALSRVRKLEARVAELEEERATIMGISQDCDGKAENPVDAFNDLLRAFEVAVTDRAELGRELRRLRQSGDGVS